MNLSIKKHFAILLGIIVFNIPVLFSQTGQYDVRFVKNLDNCAPGQLFVDIEIKATNSSSNFNVSDMNFRFSFNRDAVEPIIPINPPLTNPPDRSVFIQEELTMSGFVQKNGFTSFFNTHTLTGSNDTIISYNINLAGGDGFPLDEIDWIKVGTLRFKLRSNQEFLNLKWHNHGTFPPTFDGEKFSGMLDETAEGNYNDLTLDPNCIFLVTNTNCSGPGSLHQAILNAQASPDPPVDTPHLILFDLPPNSTVCTENISVSTSKIKIQGTGIDDLTLQGSLNNRGFILLDSACLSICDLTITGAGNPQLSGGAIVVEDSAMLEATRVLFKSNLAEAGGAIRGAEAATVIVDSCVFESNVAMVWGGAINSGEDPGLSTTTISRSIFRGNRAGARGGALFVDDGVFEMNNSVFSGNGSVQRGGAVYNINRSDTTKILSCSFGGNVTGQRGGGIYNTGVMTLGNTIVAKNITFDEGPDIFNKSSITDTLISLGGNLISDNTETETVFLAGAPNGSGDWVGASGAPLDPFFVINPDPILDSLGGDLRITCSSPAVNNGIDLLNQSSIDILGNPRVVGIAIDIGAFEVEVICQEICVVNNGVQIDFLDITPSTTNGTDYGEVCGITMDSFFIKNKGDIDLVLDTIKIDSFNSNSGSFHFNETDFTFPDTIQGGDSVLLKIIFDPLESGIDTASVCIGNNDSDEDPFTFLVSGVLDTMPPVAVCQDITINLDKSGNASITAAEIDNGSTDNCGIESLMLDKTTFTCSDLGDIPVALTVIDAIGNIDTCHAIVTVVGMPINITPHIVGLSPFCPGMTNVPYSVVPIPEVTSYQWSFSGSGATILDNGSPSISINFSGSATSGTLMVEYVTDCGPSGIKDNFSVVKASEFTCALAFNCPETLLVLNTMISFPASINLFKANTNVLSAATVETDETVLFRSGSEINLLPNFEVELGAVFGAEIQGCEEAFKEEKVKKEE